MPNLFFTSTSSLASAYPCRHAAERPRPVADPRGLDRRRRAAPTRSTSRSCAERLGYHRYWLAEHHGGPMLAGPSPEALIGADRGRHRAIRIGSGGVMLPHYRRSRSPRRFSCSPACTPGRIDLGIGRAAGTDPMTTFALQRDRRQARPDDFPEQLAELLAYYEGALPGRPPVRAARRRRCPAAPRPARAVAARLLARRARSGPASSGCPTRSPTSSTPRARRSPPLYRARFAASARLRAPRVAVAVWAICADTDEEAERLAAERRMALTLLRQGRLIPVPPPEKALRFLGARRSDGLAAAASSARPATVRAGHRGDRRGATAPRR